jgi:hypothetical protein
MKNFMKNFIPVSCLTVLSIDFFGQTDIADSSVGT